ncbi:MAG: helix-hairpin-helix domain-containing protein [Ferruginibacter sp.]
MSKRFIADYFGFTKKERTGIFVLLLLIGFFIILPFLFPFFIKEKTFDHIAFAKAIDSLKVKQADNADGYVNRNAGKFEQRSSTTYSGPQNKGELFYFDPNTASAADWKRLGIRDKTIATISNYLSKGGKFYRKEDIGKIWGLHQDEIDRLIPYIQIKNDHSTATFSAEKKYEPRQYNTKSSVAIAVDINLADTTAFIALPGIGSKLSQRIINFREKLGGFYKVEQIGETFGLADSTFQKIKPSLMISKDQLRTININVATVDEMKSHPYLRYALANAIIQYRLQHGNYLEVEGIKKIMAITEEIYNKVSPYLTVN